MCNSRSLVKRERLLNDMDEDGETVFRKERVLTIYWNECPGLFGGELSGTANAQRSRYDLECGRQATRKFAVHFQYNFRIARRWASDDLPG